MIAIYGDSTLSLSIVSSLGQYLQNVPLRIWLWGLEQILASTFLNTFKGMEYNNYKFKLQLPVKGSFETNLVTI